MPGLLASTPSRWQSPGSGSTNRTRLAVPKPVAKPLCLSGYATCHRPCRASLTSPMSYLMALYRSKSIQIPGCMLLMKQAASLSISIRNILHRRQSKPSHLFPASPLARLCQRHPLPRWVVHKNSTSCSRGCETKMAKDSSGRQRQLIAQHAARMMAEEGIADFAYAKRKAARQLGANDINCLPTNAEVEEEVKLFHDLYHSEDQPENLRRLRADALVVMQICMTTKASA